MTRLLVCLLVFVIAAVLIWSIVEACQERKLQAELDTVHFDTVDTCEADFASGVSLEKVIDMKHIFSGCTSLENIDFSNWDTSTVTDMSVMFAQGG